MIIPVRPALQTVPVGLLFMMNPGTIRRWVTYFGVGALVELAAEMYLPEYVHNTSQAEMVEQLRLITERQDAIVAQRARGEIESVDDLFRRLNRSSSPG